MLGNRKSDPVLNIRPDENYAREVLQLFSIGLHMLNPDGTVHLEGGEPVPTYDQNVVRGFAHVFTGWHFADCNAGDDAEVYADCGPGNPYDLPWRSPMEPVEFFHDTTENKQLLTYPGVALPAACCWPAAMRRRNSTPRSTTSSVTPTSGRSSRSI
jgi:hypothetical protein